jgi:hypothetical protein
MVDKATPVKNHKTHRKPEVNLTRAFQQVFFTTVSLTLLSGGTSLWLSFQEHLSPQQTRVFESCSATWQMGIGAVFGLLGSKATHLIHQEEDE